MTNAQLIGKETMLARLVVFHSARFERNGMNWKKEEYINWLQSLNTRQISKQYDATFAENQFPSNDCENDESYTERLKQINSGLKYSSALMG